MLANISENQRFSYPVTSKIYLNKWVNFRHFLLPNSTNLPTDQTYKYPVTSVTVSPNNKRCLKLVFTALN